MSLYLCLSVSEMWFMRVCPSHFLITFWYWGAYNDSFWNVRVMMCCVFSNSSLLSLQLGPTLLWEMILWIHMNWGVTVLWKERALAWEWMGVPLCRELAQRPRGGGGGHCISLGLVWPMKHQTPLSPRPVQLRPPSSLISAITFRVHWGVLVFN